ncbi:MAG: aspartate aminotransferase family protein [Alphaproteobacteria bacterium]|nr:aspartate aminotransferase family protein [Alphaproteobacteria bacterium]
MSSNEASPVLRQFLGRVDDYLLRYSKGFVPAAITRTEGSRLYDQDGREILDFASGQMCATLGHNHPVVKGAIMAALDEPMHLNSNMLTKAVVDLAEELAGLLPLGLRKSMFLSTGGESNEAALRMAKTATGGFEVLAFDAAWHGMTGGANAQTYAGARRGAGPMVPGTLTLPSPNGYRCPIRHCRDACDRTCLEVGFENFDRQTVGAGAAVICEPLLAAGGIVAPPEGYYSRLRQLADERDLLVIFDEAQTGLGRCGSMFYFEQTGIVPDILTLSKTLGGGMAMSAVVVGSELEERLHEKGFYFYTSHVSDPLPARVALAILRFLVSERIAERAKRMGDYFMTGLRALQQRHEAIGDVRGAGLLVGVELVQDRMSRKPAVGLGQRAIKRAYELGLFSTQSGGARDPEKGGMVWKLAPPLTVSEAELDRGLAIVDRAIAEAGAR